MEQFIEDARSDKVLDLEDKSGDRKFVKTKADLYANTFLTEKMSYVLGKIEKTENDDEEFKKINIDGAWVRTLEEDAAYEEELANQAADPKKGGKGGKKK